MCLITEVVKGGEEMFQGYYAEHMIRNRDRERTRILEIKRMQRLPSGGHERAVLSTDWSGWSWRRARAVLATVGVALVAALALPASLQGAAWGLREILELVIH
jgi:hypothetical protein